MSLRFYSPKYLYEVCRRTTGGAFLFDLNDEPLMSACVGALAEAQRRYDVAIYHFHFMSNHYHGLFNAPSPAKFARFLNFFHGTVATLVNQRLSRTGAVWSGKFRPLPVATDAKTLMLRMKYITGQATRARMVEHPLQFCGPSAVDWLVAGSPITGRHDGPLPSLPTANGGPTGEATNPWQPSASQKAKGARTVQISMLPCFADQDWAAVRPLFAAMADEISGTTMAELLARGAALKPLLTNQDAACTIPEHADDADMGTDRDTGSSASGRGTQPEHPNTDDKDSPATLCATGVNAKLPAPDPRDPDTGKRQTRTPPSGKDNKPKQRLVILACGAETRRAYMYDFTNFSLTYAQAMEQLGVQVARAQAGRRARMVRFPDYALLPSCVGANHLTAHMAMRAPQ